MTDVPPRTSAAFFGTILAVVHSARPAVPCALGQKQETELKLTRECRNEDQARALEASLKASGYRPWVTLKGDGSWQVFWFVQMNAAA